MREAMSRMPLLAVVQPTTDVILGTAPGNLRMSVDTDKTGGRSRQSTHTNELPANGDVKFHDVAADTSRGREDDFIL